MDDSAASLVSTRLAVTAGLDSGVSRSEHLVTIGQVVKQLRPEFPDLSITKIRYLEDRGLLAPQRTPGRYRKYSAADVRRLRSILALQRDEYLPLDVIRERLDRGTASALSMPLKPAAPLEGREALKREEVTYSWEEAREAAGVDEAFLKRLVEFHLVERASQAGGALSETDVEIARICDLLARYGVEPRNLRLAQSSAEREATLLGQVVAPTLRSTHADRREYAEKTLHDLGALLSRLLHLLLYKELRRLVD